MERRLHLLIVSAFSKKNLDELQKLRMAVNQMSQTSNWNIQYCCGEFLHSSDVVSVRELKFCEGCGNLLVRLRGSKAQFCRNCKPPVPIAQGECNDSAFH